MAEKSEKHDTFNARLQEISSTIKKYLYKNEIGRTLKGIEAVKESMLPVISQICTYLDVLSKSENIKLELDGGDITPETVGEYLQKSRSALEGLHRRMQIAQKNVNDMEGIIQAFLAAFNNYRCQYIEKFKIYTQNGQTIDLNDEFVFHELLMDGLPENID